MKTTPAINIARLNIPELNASCSQFRLLEFSLDGKISQMPMLQAAADIAAAAGPKRGIIDRVTAVPISITTDLSESMAELAKMFAKIAKKIISNRLDFANIVGN
ncbi:MAG: hypothetical protein WAS33_13865 [Candidatus Promineifilaceae bacterium]